MFGADICYLGREFGPFSIWITVINGAPNLGFISGDAIRKFKFVVIPEIILNSVKNLKIKNTFQVLLIKFYSLPQFLFFPTVPQKLPNTKNV